MIKLNKHRRNRISYYSLEALRGLEIIPEKATDLQESMHFTPNFVHVPNFPSWKLFWLKKLQIVAMFKINPFKRKKSKHCIER